MTTAAASKDQSPVLLKPWERLPVELPVVREHDVRELTGLSTSTIYEMIAAGTFPPPIKIAPRAVAWPRSHLDAWLASRVEAVAAPTRSAAGSKESRPLGRGKSRQSRRAVV